MIESRKVLEVKLGNGDTKYRVVIKSVEIPEIGNQSWFIFASMMQQLGQNLTLLNHDNLEFENLKVERKDGRWVIEAIMTKAKS